MGIEKWIHKHLHFPDDREYVIFLVWALFVSVFLTSFV
jgi:hypothetical protein